MAECLHFWDNNQVSGAPSRAVLVSEPLPSFMDRELTSAVDNGLAPALTAKVRQVPAGPLRGSVPYMYGTTMSAWWPAMT